MTATNKLGLELLQNAAANQTLANATFALLNQLVQAGVVDKDLTAPPTSPVDESLYIVGASATGLWAGYDGQLAYWLNTVGVWQFISPREGFLLHVNDEDLFYKYNGLSWEVFSGGSGGGMVNPMTSIRDIIVGGVGGAATRLAGPTSEGMVLTRIGNALAWAIATGFANPMTTAGDLIIGGASGSAVRLGADTDGQVLTLVAGAPAWVTPSGGTGSGDFKKDGSVAMTGALNEAPPVTLASAATVAIGAAAANTINISGTTTITSFDTIAAGAKRTLIFAGALTLTYNATKMKLLTSASITTAAGDTAEFESLGSGNWLMTDYVRANGTALVGSSFTGGTLTSALNEAPTPSKASAANLSFTPADLGNTFDISGTTTISDMGNACTRGTIRRLRFLASLQLTQGNLKLPSGANITTKEGDFAEFIQEGGFQWRCFNYTRADGTALVSSGGAVSSVAGRTGAVTLTSSDVGLANVNNTSDADKPVSTAQQTALNLKLDAAGPTGTGSMTLRQFSNNNGAPQFISEKNRGTQSAPLPALSNDRLGTYVFQSLGSDGVITGNVVLEAFTTEDQTSTNKGALFQFSTIKTGAAARSVAMQITGTGIATFNTGVTTATGAPIVSGGPLKLGQYTLTTLPSAATYSGYTIDVTNATGGVKQCRSDGTNWLVVNTTTIVS